MRLFKDLSYRYVGSPVFQTERGKAVLMEAAPNELREEGDEAGARGTTCLVFENTSLKRTYRTSTSILSQFERREDASDQSSSDPKGEETDSDDGSFKSAEEGQDDNFTSRDGFLTSTVVDLSIEASEKGLSVSARVNGTLAPKSTEERVPALYVVKAPAWLPLLIFVDATSLNETPSRLAGVECLYQRQTKTPIPNRKTSYVPLLKAELYELDPSGHLLTHPRRQACFALPPPVSFEQAKQMTELADPDPGAASSISDPPEESLECSTVATVTLRTRRNSREEQFKILLVSDGKNSDGARAVNLDSISFSTNILPSFKYGLTFLKWPVQVRAARRVGRKENDEEVAEVANQTEPNDAKKRSDRIQKRLDKVVEDWSTRTNWEVVLANARRERGRQGLICRELTSTDFDRLLDLGRRKEGRGASMKEVRNAFENGSDLLKGQLVIASTLPPCLAEDRAGSRSVSASGATSSLLDCGETMRQMRLSKAVAHESSMEAIAYQAATLAAAELCCVELALEIDRARRLVSSLDRLTAHLLFVEPLVNGRVAGALREAAEWVEAHYGSGAVASRGQEATGDLLLSFMKGEDPLVFGLAGGAAKVVAKHLPALAWRGEEGGEDGAGDDGGDAGTGGVVEAKETRVFDAWRAKDVDAYCRCLRDLAGRASTGESLLTLPLSSLRSLCTAYLGGGMGTPEREVGIVMASMSRLNLGRHFASAVERGEGDLVWLTLLRRTATEMLVRRGAVLLESDAAQKDLLASLQRHHLGSVIFGREAVLAKREDADVDACAPLIRCGPPSFRSSSSMQSLVLAASQLSRLRLAPLRSAAANSLDLRVGETAAYHVPPFWVGGLPARSTLDFGSAPVRTSSVVRAVDALLANQTAPNTGMRVEIVAEKTVSGLPWVDACTVWCSKSAVEKRTESGSDSERTSVLTIHFKAAFPLASKPGRAGEPSSEAESCVAWNASRLLVALLMASVAVQMEGGPEDAHLVLEGLATDDTSRSYSRIETLSQLLGTAMFFGVCGNDTRLLPRILRKSADADADADQMQRTFERAVAWDEIVSSRDGSVSDEVELRAWILAEFHNKPL